VAEKERTGKTYSKTLHVGGVLMPKIASGQVSVTGAGVITLAGFNTVTSCVVSLGATPAAGESFATATISGNAVTISVWTSSDAASTTATVINYIATGT
jgi:hypothetical protein